MEPIPTPDDEATNPAAFAEDEQAFWEATASDALRQVWDTAENEAWDTFYQQEQAKENLPSERLI